MKMKYIDQWERDENAQQKQGSLGLPWWSGGKESAGQYKGDGFDPWSGKIPQYSLYIRVFAQVKR